MDLNIKQRLVAVGIYVAMILGIGNYFTDNWEFLIDTNNFLNPLLIVVGLAIVFGRFVSEPFFTKPIDVLTKWVSILLFVWGLNSKDCLSLYNYWIGACVIFIAISTWTIFFHSVKRFEKFQRLTVDIICKISRPEIVFTFLYVDLVVSFFSLHPKEYPVLIAFGFLLAVNKPIVWIIKTASSWLGNIQKKNVGNYLGKVIGHESSDLYKVEISEDVEIQTANLKGKLVYLDKQKYGTIGIILNEYLLLGRKWFTVATLRNERKDPIIVDLDTFKPFTSEKSIFSKTNSIYLLIESELSEDVLQVINRNKLYKNFENLIGCVWEGSTINKIRFNKLFTDDLFKSKSVGEGSIICTTIGDKEVLYQIIDAKTDEETLEHKDSHGFTIGTAQKLGEYNIDSHELNTVKWLPEIYTPIFLLTPTEIEYETSKFIGKLPNTNYGIPIKHPHELVTHNTAILGILGVGKSCLTFELLQKLINSTEVKIFCIDLTNQYAKELPKYINADLIQEDISQTSKDDLKAGNVDGNFDNYDSWGNVKIYNAKLKTEIESFIASEKRVLTLNPDWHQVAKAGSDYKITRKVDLTAAEKTRIISEKLFLKAQSLYETSDARYLIIFEEAHSLVPEWNSVANDGDKSATNGTAKIILQGRKYGLGSFVITQRTANISKSILNQCNTVFALRVFDDTGKAFLENYIGADYSNLLGTLEDRHCIAIGKALKLKQPVILKLNETEEIQINALQQAAENVPNLADARLQENNQAE